MPVRSSVIGFLLQRVVPKITENINVPVKHTTSIKTATREVYLMLNLPFFAQLNVHYYWFNVRADLIVQFKGSLSKEKNG